MDLKDTNRLGTYHISSGIQDFESARSNFFTLIVDDLDDLLYPQYSYTGENADNEYITRTGNIKNERSGQDIIKLSVNKMFVPHFNLNVLEVRRGNSVVKFTDTPTWDAGTIELQDFVGLETKNVLMAWQALAYDVNSDTQGRAGDWIENEGSDNEIRHRGYKRKCTLTEYSPDFEKIRSWDLIGCWISNISESPFDVEATGARSLSVTLQYDRAVMKMPASKFSSGQ